MEINKTFCDETADLKTNVESQFLILGERLKKIRDEKLYDGYWHDFEEYVNDAMSMSKANSSKLINIYEKFSLAYHISEKRLAKLGKDKLQEILPMVHDAETAAFWIDKAENMKRRDDLRREIAEFKTGIPAVECGHANVYTLKVCRLCKSRWVEDNESLSNLPGDV